MSFPSSKVWIAPGARERERYRATQIGLDRLYTEFAQVPRTWEDWLQFRYDTIMALKEKLQHQIDEKERQRQDPTQSHHQILEPFGGKVFDDGRGAVLGWPTLWTHGQYFHLEKRYGSWMWPSRPEYIFEGDDRVRTCYGRYFPIPRAWTRQNLYTNFQNMPHLPPMAFDWVSPPPSGEDIYFPVEQIEEDSIPALLNTDLLAALNT